MLLFVGPTVAVGMLLAYWVDVEPLAGWIRITRLPSGESDDEMLFYICFCVDW